MLNTTKNTAGTIAILAEKDFQDLELWYPYLRLKEAGFKPLIVGCGEKSYKGKYGYPVTVDCQIGEVKADELSGVIIPGGWAPDFLRKHTDVLHLVKDCHESGKLVAAICHAGWVLISAGILKGLKVTSFEAIKDDLINAGACWVNQEVVVDKNLITSRTPLDLPEFCKAIIAFLK